MMNVRYQDKENRSVSDENLSVDSGRDSLTSKTSMISFGTVSVYTHDMTLGDNPSVTTGPPLMLDWVHLKSECFHIDHFEQLNQGRRKKARRIPRNDREAWLQKKGYSRECLDRVLKEIEYIKTTRRQTKLEITCLKKFEPWPKVTACKLSWLQKNRLNCKNSKAKGGLQVGLHG